jgi:hypothetical protein
MTRTLRAFMHELIDYAGLFPPARLSMADAVESYARHLDSQHAWMLARFICPVGRLEEFSGFRQQLERHAPVRLSMLGTPPSGADDYHEMAQLDANLVTGMEAEGWARATQLEVRWPTSLVDVDPLRRYCDGLREAGCTYEKIFFEIDRAGTWQEDVLRTVDILATTGDNLGLKIRTGGLTPDLYPTPAEVAVAIEACKSAGVPLKATAGLHHPIRHDQPQDGITQHGFFNVFGASILSHSLSLSPADLTMVLEDRQISAFRFGMDTFSWRDHHVELDQLESARRELAFSFGSCSFDEPIEDLQAARLLDL